MVIFHLCDFADRIGVMVVVMVVVDLQQMPKILEVCVKMFAVPRYDVGSLVPKMPRDQQLKVGHDPEKDVHRENVVSLVFARILVREENDHVETKRPEMCFRICRIGFHPEVVVLCLTFQDFEFIDFLVSNEHDKLRSIAQQQMDDREK